MVHIQRPLTLLAAICICVVSTSCKKEQPPPPHGPLPVSVTYPVERQTTEYLYFNGLTRGLQETTVIPRVAGYLDKVNYRPDTQVNAGDLLFTMDQRPYRVAVQRSQAELAGKRAAVASTDANLQRAKRLVEQKAATDQELIERQAAYDLAVAEVGVAEAEVAKANLDLAYTEIKAPISGRVNRNQVDEGTLLSANGRELTTIVNDEQIYVDFNVSESEYLTYLRKNPTSRTKESINIPPVVVELAMSDEMGYPHRGEVASADNALNVATGTLGVRAIFNNTEKQIAPGLYVRIRALMGSVQALLVPDVALQADARGQFVYIANAKDAVERRSVTTGVQIGAMRQILDGLTTKDRVIIDGLMMARPELPVTPTVVPPPDVPTTQAAPDTTQPTADAPKSGTEAKPAATATAAAPSTSPTTPATAPATEPAVKPATPSDTTPADAGGR